MRKVAFTTLAALACLGLAGCGDRSAEGTNQADNNLATTGGEEGGNATTAGASASASYPKGARFVQEDGVTWRIDPDGNRVRLADVRIVTENGVRYRVDQSGTRVRIDDRGLDLDVDLPDVDVGINKKGNPDIDVTEDVDVDVRTKDNPDVNSGR